MRMKNFIIEYSNGKKDEYQCNSIENARAWAELNKRYSISRIFECKKN